MTTLRIGVCVLCLYVVTSRGQLQIDSPAASRPVSVNQDQLSAQVGKGGRRLQQSALQLSALDPVSATTADLVDDPTGRGHLLVTYIRIAVAISHGVLQKLQRRIRDITGNSKPRFALSWLLLTAGSVGRLLELHTTIHIPVLPRS